MNPTFSVVVSVYNVAPYLESCLDSILAQTYGDFELICVEDCSTDKSLSILEAYAAREPRMTILRHEKNRGLSAARNTGLEHASGDYVYFLDSDDEILPTLLAQAAAAMEADALDLFSFSQLLSAGAAIHPGELLSFEISQTDSGVQSGEDFLTSQTAARTFACAVCLYVYRRSFLLDQQLRFPEGLIYEDLLFTPTALLAAKRVRHQPLALFHYRLRPNSITTSKWGPENLRCAFLAVMGLYRLAGREGLSAGAREAIVFNMDGVMYLMRLIAGALPKDAWKTLEGKLPPEDFRMLALLLEPDARLQKQLSEFQRTPDYRIGATILYLPRMIWRPIFRMLKKWGVL